MGFQRHGLPKTWASKDMGWEKEDVVSKLSATKNLMLRLCDHNKIMHYVHSVYEYLLSAYSFGIMHV